MNILDPNHQCIKVQEKSLKPVDFKSKTLDRVTYNIELHKKMNFYYVTNGEKIFWFKSLEMAGRFYCLKVWHKDLKVVWGY